MFVGEPPDARDRPENPTDDSGSQQRSAAITGRRDLPSRGVAATETSKTLDDAHAAVAWTIGGNSRLVDPQETGG